MKLVCSRLISGDLETIELKAAIRLACTELIEIHRVEDEELASLFEIIAQEIIDDYNAGHRDTSVLGQHATMKALMFLGRRLH